MAFRWRVDDGPLNAGLVAFFRGSGPVLQRNPIFFLFFRGGGADPLPPLDPHMELATGNVRDAPRFVMDRIKHS